MAGTPERGPEYRRWLSGATVSVVGLARSGVAAARLIRRLGGRVLASDSGPAASLPPAARSLESAGCRLWTGGHPREAFADADLVVVSPGVPLTLPALASARARGVPVIGELELGWRAMESDVIAITGTNGKTTTTALTGELLRAQVRPTLVAGNIGTPLSEHALDFPADGLVVAEVSSFQLESTDRFHPRVAAVLNITPDHLDRHGSMADYVEAKARIFANQTPSDCAVLNFDDPLAARLAMRAPSHILWFSRLRPLDHGVFVRDGWIVAKLNGHVESICPVAEVMLRGQHNVENVLAATACALWTGMSPEAIRRGVAGFRGVEHRIERVWDDRGVDLLQRLQGHQCRLDDQGARELHRAGGPDRRREGQGAGLRAPRRGRPRPRPPRRAHRRGPRQAAGPLASVGIATEDASTMEDAVRRARGAARVGDVVLLSPACASFDMFENFEHRGRAFKAAVRALAG